MRTLLTLVAVVSLLAVAAPASAGPLDCINCDPINKVCQRLWGVNCVASMGGSEEADPALPAAESVASLG